MPHPVIDSALRFRGQLLTRSAWAEQRMVRAYGRAYQRLLPQIGALEEAVSSLEGASRGQVRRLAAMRSLRRQIQEEIGRYAIVADQEVLSLTEDAVRLGLQGSRITTEAYFEPAFLRERGLARSSQGARGALRASWTQLSAAQVQTSVGFLSEDSPLHTNMVRRLGPTVARRMENKLTEAIVLGINPRQIAREARDELGIGLTYSMNTARTAQMWAYREASRQNYLANSDVLDGWVWYSALDSRVCAACLSKHGQRFPLTETLNGHHQCRCVPLPTGGLMREIGIAPDIEPGETWFNAQPDATRASILGPGMLAAYNAGAVPFAQLAQEYDDSAYGTMVRAPSMESLLGERAQEFYVR